VVDGTALKVFKYTLSSGKLLGSWAIDPANTHPTGITINPNNVSDIWIVDNGTLKVYQYVGAASRTSGSQSASATFALAASDTNPQGIADPPPADMLLTTAASVNDAAADTSVVAGDPSLSGRDALFALLVRESLPGAGAPTRALQADGGFTPNADRLAAIADLMLPLTGAVGAPESVDPLLPVHLGSSQGLVATMDDLFAGLADDAPPAE